MSAYLDKRGDKLLAALADFTTHVSDKLDATTLQHTQNALTDALAVALGALGHGAVPHARKFAALTPVQNGATVWGTSQRTTAEIAALVNGVPLRGYDYNDFYVGVSGGHPSDMIPGLIALAETRGLSGSQLLSAIALGYEVCIFVLDAIDVDTNRWDYPNIIAIGATCAASRMLGLTEDQTAEALAIAVVTQFASDEVESGDLNERGDLTMWKRFNSGHAIRQAIYCATLAQVGVEGAVRPFEGKSGFLSKVTTREPLTAALIANLLAKKPLSRIADTQFKRWPVGSRGQSAIQAAFEARAGIKDATEIESVLVKSDKEVYEHLLGRRADPWHPVSRETADHSLAYIVGAAVLDGKINTASFDLDKVLDKSRIDFINSKIKIEISQELSTGSAGGFISSVEITGKDGRKSFGKATPPPGHRLNKFKPEEFAAKFKENVVPVLGDAKASSILAKIGELKDLKSIESFTALLAA